MTVASIRSLVFGLTMVIGSPGLPLSSALAAFMTNRSWPRRMIMLTRSFLLMAYRELGLLCGSGLA